MLKQIEDGPIAENTVNLITPNPAPERRLEVSILISADGWPDLSDALDALEEEVQNLQQHAQDENHIFVNDTAHHLGRMHIVVNPQKAERPLRDADMPENAKAKSTKLPAREDMRISTRPDDPAYRANAEMFIAFLNGEEAVDCCTPDEAEGYVDCYVRDNNGELIKEFGEHRTERFYGKVEICRRRLNTGGAK